MNFPEWQNLLEFATWFEDNGYPQHPPVIPKVYQTDVSLSVCVFEYHQYQVEFYIAQPNFLSSKHYHNFEQVIIFMGGSGRGRRGDHLDEESDWVELNYHSIGKPGNILLSTQWHQIQSYEHGMYFYNCQLWPSNTNLTSAVVEYRGDSLGPIHSRIKVL